MLPIADSTSDSHDDHEDNKRNDDDHETFTALLFLLLSDSSLRCLFLECFGRHPEHTLSMHRNLMGSACAACTKCLLR